MCVAFNAGNTYTVHVCGMIVHMCRMCVGQGQCVHPLFCTCAAHFCSYSTHISMCTIYMLEFGHSTLYYNV